jgi:hypothetical protein
MKSLDKDLVPDTISILQLRLLTKEMNYLIVSAITLAQIVTLSKSPQ